MFKWLGNIIGLRTARKMIADNPALRAALIASHDTFNSLPLKESLTKESTATLSSQMMDEWKEIFSAENPILACREKLAGWMYEYAQYQVIVLGPAPDEDPTGLRGQPGITGEIKQHRVELAKVNKDLRELLYGVVSEVTENAVWDICLMRYWKAHWFLMSFNAIRKEFGDYNATGKDWYWPFLHSQCAFREDSYRQELGLPAALGPLQAVMYATFLEFVTNGSKYPDLAWREHYEDAISDGTLRLPNYGS